MAEIISIILFVVMVGMAVGLAIAERNWKPDE